MRLTISRKLMGSFLLIALMLGITSAISYYFLDNVDKLDSDLIDRRSAILSNAQKIQAEAYRQEARIRGYLLTQDKEFVGRLQESNENLSKLIEETNKLVQIEDDRIRLKKLQDTNQELKQQYDIVLQMMASNQPMEKVIAYYKETVLPLGRQLDPVADEMAMMQLNRMAEGSEKVTALINTAVTVMMVLSLVSIPLAIGIALVISRMISRPIVQMAHVAEQIAQGDLTSEDIRVKNKDEIAVLAASFNQMKENLRTLIGQVNHSADLLAGASEELTASAEQTSSASEIITTTIQEVVASAENQASSITESVQSVNEMSSGMQQIASSSQMTANLSTQASERAQQGHQAIQKAVTQMDNIDVTMKQLAQVVDSMEEHSSEIGQIVEVITGIAEQTNLLALNAAIEAARAGEQGRGFAVVADEVRKLAEQSSLSAGKITQLISNIQKQTQEAVQAMDVGTQEVSEGIEVVHTAGQLFEEIKQDVDDVASQIHDISAVSEQISASAVQVVHSVELISRESNAVAEQSQDVSSASEEQLAAMEEISANAASLARMAEELQKAIGKFKV